MGLVEFGAGLDDGFHHKLASDLGDAFDHHRYGIECGLWPHLGNDRHRVERDLGTYVRNVARFYGFAVRLEIPLEVDLWRLVNSPRMRYILAGLVVFLTACSRKDTPSVGVAARPAFTFLTNTVGKSMLPTFGENEWVKVSLEPWTTVKKGDTVIRWHELAGGIYVHHRVDSWDPVTGAWYTKGDNNAFPDRSRMFQVDYVGKTSKIFPDGQRP